MHVDPLETVQRLDASGLAWAKTNLVPPGTAKAIGFLAGDYAPLVFVPVVLVWLARGRGRAIRIALVAMICSAVTLTIAGVVLAPLVHRAPPGGSGNFSFPSLAAANSFALGTLFALYFIRHGWWIFLAMLTFAIAPVAAGACWPSDAITGATLGFFLGYLFWLCTRNNLGARSLFVASAGEIAPSSARKMSRR